MDISKIRAVLLLSVLYVTVVSDQLDNAMTLAGIELFMYDKFGKGALTMLVMFVGCLTGTLLLMCCCWCGKCCCFRRPFRPQATQIVVTQPGYIQNTAQPRNYPDTMQQPLILG